MTTVAGSTQQAGYWMFQNSLRRLVSWWHVQPALLVSSFLLLLLLYTYAFVWNLGTSSLKSGSWHSLYVEDTYFGNARTKRLARIQTGRWVNFASWKPKMMSARRGCGKLRIKNSVIVRWNSTYLYHPCSHQNSRELLPPCLLTYWPSCLSNMYSELMLVSDNLLCVLMKHDIHSESIMNEKTDVNIPPLNYVI